MLQQRTAAISKAQIKGYLDVHPERTTQAEIDAYRRWCREFRRPLVIVTRSAGKFFEVEMEMDSTGLGELSSRDPLIDYGYHDKVTSLFKAYVPKKLPYSEDVFGERGLSPWTVGDWPASTWIPRRSAETVALRLLKLGLEWARHYLPEIGAKSRHGVPGW